MQNTLCWKTYILHLLKIVSSGTDCGVCAEKYVAYVFVLHRSTMGGKSYTFTQHCICPHRLLGMCIMLTFA